MFFVLFFRSGTLALSAKHLTEFDKLSEAEKGEGFSVQWSDVEFPTDVDLRNLKATGIDKIKLKTKKEIIQKAGKSFSEVVFISNKFQLKL